MREKLFNRTVSSMPGMSARISRFIYNDSNNWKAMVFLVDVLVHLVGWNYLFYATFLNFTEKIVNFVLASEVAYI